MRQPGPGRILSMPAGKGLAFVRVARSAAAHSAPHSSKRRLVNRQLMFERTSCLDIFRSLTVQEPHC
eukprot:359499-Chlamydomonas_euryale.AAC.2